MTEEKSEMLIHEGIYCGKEFRREFKKKNEKGEEISGKIYGIKIKDNMEQQFGKSFTIFSTTKGFGTYEEGDRVKLGYVVNEFTNKNGQLSKSHVVLWIGKATDQATQTKLTNLSLQNFDTFKVIYMKAMGGKNFDAVHMLGSYIATYETERVAELLQKCKEAVKQ